MIDGYVPDASVEETGHHILHWVGDWLPLRIRACRQVLLHLTHIIDPFTVALQALIHQSDVQGVLFVCVCVCVCVIEEVDNKCSSFHCTSPDCNNDYCILLQDQVDT